MPDTVQGETRHVVDLVPGGRYQFKGVRGPDKDGQSTWKFPPSVYRLIGLAHDYRYLQDRVVYIGVNRDHDHGKRYICGLADWQEQFTRIMEANGQ